MKKTLLMAALVGGLVACQNAAETKTDTVAKTDSLPNTATTETSPSPTAGTEKMFPESMSEQTADLVRKTLQSKLKADLDKQLIDSLSRKFSFFEYDLNEDGLKEIFVATTGPYFCGSGGCNIYLLDNQGNIITVFTVSDYPVVVDNAKSKGWKDLFIRSGGEYRIVKYNGKSYPSNPSVQPALKVEPGDGLPHLLDMSNATYPSFSF